MSFRQINRRYLEPGSMWLMIFGIAALCQPWNFFLHRYGVTIILVGLVGFLITSHIPPEEGKPSDENDDRVFDVSDHREGKA